MRFVPDTTYTCRLETPVLCFMPAVLDRTKHCSIRVEHGFRVIGIDRDFFVKNHDAPISEDGIQLKGMLRLSLKYTN